MILIGYLVFEPYSVNYETDKDPVYTEIITVKKIINKEIFYSSKNKRIFHLQELKNFRHEIFIHTYKRKSLKSLRVTFFI